MCDLGRVLREVGAGCHGRALVRLIYTGAVRGALCARADLTESTGGGASGTERERRGLGWPDLVGDGRARSRSFQGRRRLSAATCGTAVLVGVSWLVRAQGRGGSWAWLAAGEALVCGAGNTGVVASWTAWRSDGSSSPGSTAPAGAGRLSPFSDRERGERKMTAGARLPVREE